MNEKIKDFGFTDQDEPEVIKDNRLQRLEALVMPLLEKLLSTADNPTIKWPNRREPLEKLISEIKEITKS